ncbi:hypothetical protein L914_03620, partial [Phytophthora nicotianae]
TPRYLAGYRTCVPAKSTSKNQVAETLLTKNVNITRKIYKKMLLEGVSPAIKKSGQV